MGIRQKGSVGVTTNETTADTTATLAGTLKNAANAKRLSLHIHNTSAITLYYRLDSTLPTSASAFLVGGDSYEAPDNAIPAGSIHILAASGTPTVTIRTTGGV